jgi:hypothetical protein
MMRYDREWNDRVRTEEVETVPRGKPLRDLLFLIAASAAVAYGLSQSSTPGGVREIAVQQALPSAE